MSENKNYRFETLQLHVGQEQPDPASDARAVPIYATTSYVFKNSAHAAARFGLADAGNIYGRLTNSTQDVFEKRIAALEGGVAALATASGAAAITYTIQALAKQGENIVASNTIYGGTYNLLAHTLPLYGVTAKFVDPYVEGSFEAAIDENTKALYVESLGNPNSNVADIQKLAQIAHKHNIPLVVDSTFATPYLLRPIEYGADIVVHSATKFIGGHGTAIGGVIVDSGNFDWKKSGAFPWISAHVFNALKVVEYLSKHPQVEAVHHPSLASEPTHELYKKYFPNGGGSIFTFEVKGTAADAQKFIDNLPIFSLLANVADVKSLVIHPASTTHSQLTEEELAEQGIKPNTIRLSIGTEHIDDLIDALDTAFAAIK